MLSVIYSIIISGIIALAVPFATPTAEILARTSPTILDLLVALASGSIAILSLGFNKLSESIA